MNFNAHNWDSCRARFIAATADFSATGELHDIPINFLNLIIGPHAPLPIMGEYP
jgi:hypothetical protein